MNNKCKILSLLLILSIQIIVFGSENSSLSSSSLSSSSSSMASTFSVLSSSSSSSKQSSEYHEKVLTELKKIKEVDIFPGLIPIIGSYLKLYPEKATEDLLNAVRNNNLDKNQKLIDVKDAIAYGANVNCPYQFKTDDYFDSALKYSLLYEISYKIVEELIKAGANVTAQYTLGNEFDPMSRNYSPLLDAIWGLWSSLDKSEPEKNEIVQVIELLLQNGANPNSRFFPESRFHPDRNIEVPLIFAAHQYEVLNTNHTTHKEQRIAYLKLIKLLFKYNADPSIGKVKSYTNQFETFADIAARNPEIREIYLQYLQKK